MIPQDIKQTSIREYLNNTGVHPVMDYGYYEMYHCPYREDRNASFKVDYNKNVWHDFETSEGGSIIDLVMKINNYSLKEAITEINQCFSTTVRQINSVFNKANIENQGISIQNVIPVILPELTAWVRERKIDLDLTNLYCWEIHYWNRDKEYFSIGFRNDVDGYELSSPPNFKGCISPKDITAIRSKGDTCLVLGISFRISLFRKSKRRNMMWRAIARFSVEQVYVSSVSKRELSRWFPFKTCKIMIKNKKGGWPKLRLSENKWRCTRNW